MDRLAYKSYLRIFDYHLQKTALKMLQPSKRACLTGIALLVNDRVGLQKETMDFRDGRAAMYCFEITKGEMFACRRWKLKRGASAGDVIFLRAAVFEHFVSYFEGDDRYVFVFFTKLLLSRSIYMLLRNYFILSQAGHLLNST